MNAARADLWPEDLSSSAVVPATILKDQAAALYNKTKGRLEGKVETTVGSLPSSLAMALKSGTSPDAFVHSFYVQAPLLNYRRKLFTVRHGTADFYPLIIAPEVLEPTFQSGLVQDEESLLIALKALLNSGWVHKILTTLLAQSK